MELVAVVLVAGGAGGVAVEHTEVITHGQAETVGEVEAHTAAEHALEQINAGALGLLGI